MTLARQTDIFVGIKCNERKSLVFPGNFNLYYKKKIILYIIFQS